MKLHLLLLHATALLAVATPLPAEPDEPPAAAELTRAFVTIPYVELRSLWEAGHAAQSRTEKPAPALLGSVVQEAELQLQLGDRSSLLVAKFGVEVLTAQWQTIALLDGEVQLEKAEAAGRQIVSAEGYALLTNQPGPAAVVLQCRARGAKSLTPQNPLRLKLDRATVKRLRVAGIPDGLEARVDGQVATEVKDGVAVFALRGEPAEVALHLAEPRSEPAPKPLTASRWQTQSQTLVRYAEGRLQFRSHTFAHSDAGSGLELCKEIRRQSNVPVIFLTARGAEVDRIVGLEIGGDDYIVKPFSPRELCARVKAVLRRFQAGASVPLGVAGWEAGPFRIDEDRAQIHFGGERLALSGTEFRLLRALCQKPGRVYSRASLMEIAWDDPGAALERTVDAHIKSLRAKLKEAQPDLDPIETHRGFGYSLREDA